jgi:hypothetical protein
MPRERKHPVSVAVSFALVSVAARLVPPAQREEWKQEWCAEIWHRWQFLFHTGEWTRPEKLRLLRNTLGAFLDAAWLLASQEAVWDRLRELARSPFSCLAALAGLLLLVTALSSGLPATRELLSHAANGSAGKLLFILLHPEMGGGDKGLPTDLVPAWASHSRLLRGVAAFQLRHRPVSVTGAPPARTLVIDAQPALFDIVGVKPKMGGIPRETGVVLDDAAWRSLTHADPAVVGSRLNVGGAEYRVAAVLPARFRFLSRQPAIFLIHREITNGRVFAVALLRPGVTQKQLDRELTRIAQDVCYYFLKSQLRFAFQEDMLLAPLSMFGVASLVASLLAVMVFRFRFKYVRLALKSRNRQAASRRALFFGAKAALALSCVFVACLEWSRSASSVLLASQDPGNGPFLLWLYILGTMGVLFWALADQRARCRVCLRLLAFPVRIGCPGCLLLDWSGIELFCSEGHGVLHVPHLAPSWDEEPDRWILLDESWQDLFAHSK